MSPKVFNIANLVIAIVSAVITFLTKGNNDKILDGKIAEKVAEELAKRNV